MAMRPFCCVCGIDLALEELTGIGGDQTRFADYAPPSGASDPWGVEWFCDLHLRDARSRTHLDVRTAVHELWAIHGPRPDGGLELPQVWIESPGEASRLQVLKALRDATGESPAETTGILHR